MKQPYWRRFLICIAGLAILSLSNVLGVKAGSAGANAWTTLSIGIAGLTKTSFGTANLAVGLAIIGIDLLGKGKLGVGTLMNAFLVSWFSDIFLKLLWFIPEASNQAIGVVYTLTAQFLGAFSTILYMTAGLGCGPRDTLMVLIGQKFPRAPIGIVKFSIEIAALTVGVLLGAPFGIGTVLIMALQAGIFQFACRVTRYEPRAIVHEDVLQTVGGLMRAVKPQNRSKSKEVDAPWHRK